MISDAPFIYELPQNLSVAEPSTAMFNCSATGHPRPTLSWQIFSNGVYTTVSQSNKYAITNAPLGEQNQTSTLTIFNTSPQDSAQYECNAVNVLGSIGSTMATLNVRGKSNTSALMQLISNEIFRNSTDIPATSRYYCDCVKYRCIQLFC